MHRRWAALSLFLLAGCVKVPEQDLAQTTSSPGIESVTREALETGDFALGDWPISSWWEEFEDPVLTGLIEEGLQSNPTLMRAESRLNAAAQIALEKRAALFPQITFDPTDLWQHYSKNGFFRTYAPDIPAIVNDIVINLTFNYSPYAKPVKIA